MNKKSIVISLHQKGVINGKREKIYVEKYDSGPFICKFLDNDPILGSLYEITNYIYNDFGICFEIIGENGRPLLTLFDLEDYISEKFKS